MYERLEDASWRRGQKTGVSERAAIGHERQARRSFLYILRQEKRRAGARRDEAVSNNAIVCL